MIILALSTCWESTPKINFRYWCTVFSDLKIGRKYGSTSLRRHYLFHLYRVLYNNLFVMTFPLTRSILLTELHPKFECSMDTKEYGTLVLKGREKHDDLGFSTSLVDISSLSILLPSLPVKADKGINCDWRLQPLWTSEQELDINGRKVQIPKLQDILKMAAVSTKCDREQPQWEVFYQQATAIFLALLSALEREERIHAEKNEISRRPIGEDRYLLSPRDLMELHRQLEDIEANSQQADIICLSPDLSTLTLSRVDKSNRSHELVLDLAEFPAHTAVRASPIPPILRNQENSGKESTKEKKRKQVENISLSALYSKFCAEVACCQALWNQLDDLDRNAWVLEATFSKEGLNKCQRSIYLDEGAKLNITLDPLRPTEKPVSFEFVGSRSHTFRKAYEECSAWSKRRSVRENLEACFGKSLAKPCHRPQFSLKGLVSKCLDCAICFTSTVENADALSGPVVNCESEQCTRCYHSQCLEKWLSTLSTTRTSFDTLLGACPYCKGPIAVTMR